MDFDICSNSMVTLKKQVSVLGLTVLVLAVSLGVVLVTNASRHDRIVIVPPGLAGPVAVDWGRADTEYLKTFGLFYATLIGTITPRNAEYVADRLSGMTAAAVYPQIRKQILAVAKDPSFTGSGSTTNFVSNTVIYEPETGLVFVLGDNQTYSGFGGAKMNPVVYEIAAEIIEGRPVVNSVTNYPGTEARTAAWKVQHPDWNKEKEASK
jgi:conjugal transfer pilus assembly protein TraE